MNRNARNTILYSFGKIPGNPHRTIARKILEMDNQQSQYQKFKLQKPDYLALSPLDFM